MASSGSITTGQKEGRSVTLSWTLSSQNIANNTSRHKSTAPPLDFTPVVRLFFTSVQSEDLQATSSLLAQG